MRNLYILLFILTLFPADAQVPDSLTLPEISITSYFISRPLMRIPSSASVIDSVVLHYSSSLDNAVNSVPGVQMDERSPGSYRLSIRGSLLRSPFGIRNVKIYINDFPMTDAGGNTYLNLIDYNAVSRVEILKGPDGSLFGANSGGVIKVSVHDTVHKAKAGILAGSYENVNPFLRLGVFKKHRMQLFGALKHLQGYRDHSSLNNIYTQLSYRVDYSAKASLTFFGFYSRLKYDTPGGLTIEQYNASRKKSRPSSAFPGAEEQKAGVNNNTVFAGLSNAFFITAHLKHVISVSGSYTDFENPFITNYEKRFERNGAVRTYLQTDLQLKKLFLKLTAGAEGQAGNYRIYNFGNRSGNADTIQASDRILVGQGFIFSQITCDYNNRLLAEAGISYNFNRFNFSMLPNSPDGESHRSLKPVLMPKMGLSWLLFPGLSIRASAGKGFSPPTIAEIRSSDKKINNDLEPEEGWNYEAGFRIKNIPATLRVDAAVFRFELKDAIVRRLNDAGDEYFVNSGGVRQQGIEIECSLRKQIYTSVLEYVSVGTGYSYSDFQFTEYILAESDNSGNKLTGVPDHKAFASAGAGFKSDIYAFISYRFNSSIPLNDANDVFSDESMVFYIKAGCKKMLAGSEFNISVGINNVFNEYYISGYDLNAAGGRYYNAAPERNYYLQLTITI